MLMDIFSRLDFWCSKTLFTTIFNLIFFFILDCSSFGIPLLAVSIFLSTYFLSDYFNNIFNFLLVGAFRKYKVYINRLINGRSLLISRFFIFILSLKILGLFPLIFSITSQVIITLSLSLTFWLALNISKLRFNFVSFWSHLTPLGSPIALNPILNIIELVSNLIRFITLSLRLRINITTGHVFLTLISIFTCFETNNLLPGLILFFAINLLGIFYLVFELAIGFIQAFVFSLLCSQYLEEHRI